MDFLVIKRSLERLIFYENKFLRHHSLTYLKLKLVSNYFKQFIFI